jgi:hypothetical protein
LSKRFGAVHLENPPVRKVWNTFRYTTTTPATVRWFRRVSETVETLVIARPKSENEATDISHLIAVGKLAKLEVVKISPLGVLGYPIVRCLPLLRQIKRLSMKALEFPKDGSVHPMNCLAGLRSLQVGM